MAKGFKKGAGGANPLNFKVVGGTTAPVNPRENTIWVNTDVKITSWHFGADEPNVYNLALHRESDWHTVAAPHELSAGEILNFTIPKSVPHTFEALAIIDHTGKFYYVRAGDKTALKSWEAGVKIGVIISNDVNPIGAYAGHGTAYLMSWDSYYHEEGTVWITTGTPSPVAMNALKKNSITVYPISAKLFSGGMWWDAEAKSYQNGEWVEWFTYFVNGGDQCVDRTGGWAAYAGTSGWATGSVASTDSALVITINNASVNVRTKNFVDLSNINTLYINAQHNFGSHSSDRYTVSVGGASKKLENGLTSLDVSNVSSGQINIFAESDMYSRQINVTKMYGCA